MVVKMPYFEAMMWDLCIECCAVFFSRRLEQMIRLSSSSRFYTKNKAYRQ